MADIVKISPNNFSFQSYQGKDTSLMSQFDVNSFLTETSYIEFFVYNQNNIILNSNLNYRQYDILNDGQSAGNNNQISQFNISPEVDIANAGFNTGEYVAYYNFLVKQVGDNFSNFFISEISSDRTEIRLDSNTLSGLDIKNQTGDFITFRENQDYFVDFYLNFGNNNLIIANNIKLENPKTSNATILVKLYEPLPSEFDLKDNLWIVTTLNEPEAFRVTYPIETTSFTDTIQIQGPNYNIPVKNQVNNSSENLSYSDIINGASTSSMDQVNSLLEETSINISVDYSDFSEFIHFSSAQTRIENFEYKVKLIESYNSELDALNSITSSNSSITPLKAKISDIVKNFDKFEYFMYYSSGSMTSWPKSTTELPYVLYPSTSSQVLTWIGSVDEQNSNYGGLLLSSSYYDNANPDQLKKAIPEYLREDSANHQYDLFVDMVAQYYDNVWLYTKDVTQKYNADNRLDFGVSKELVADAIRDFGVKLYQNNFSNKDLYTAFLGMTPEGSVFPFPNITGSTPAPSGYELVDVMISASNDVISMDDTNKSLYKRIYHNIPYLLNTKGTITGLRALITSYGIPDTILRISEFGGKDKVNENDWDYYFNNFNYAWDTEGTNSIRTQWEINSEFASSITPVPGTVELRFKTEGLPGSRVSQSLWFTTSSAGIDKAVVLEYTGSGLTSGSYNGSIPDPYNQYGTLKYISQPGTVNEISCSVYLPFFDGEWWSVMIRNNGFNAFDPELIVTEPTDYDFVISEDGDYIVRERSTTSSITNLEDINLFAANKIYNGNDGTSIGFKASASLQTPSASVGWTSGDLSYFAEDFTAGSTYQNFLGNMQEVRYYSISLGTTRFYDYTMNPLSIEGNGINASPDQLSFRTSLGAELDIDTTTSIHPKVTGSWETIPSFNVNSNYFFKNSPNFVTNDEYYFLDQFPAGIKNRITDKIRSENVSLPEGNVLSPIRRLSQTTEASASYTDNLNYLEVAFSPQNQINDDIISQIGYFNLGDYVGDPRQRFTGNRYKDLNNLSEEYFKKYIKQYDLTDFVRLIKFFDNSLFKMIKDFIPTRTSLASGLVVKQHLLERNKYPQPQASLENKILTGSIDMVEISGGPGGVFNELNAPAPEIIFTISSDYSLPGPPLPSQFFQDITASLNSTIRGKLREYNLPSGSSLTTEAIKMYDGERFFLQAKKHASSSITPLTVFEYQISSSSGISSEDYGFWAVCQIQNNNTSSFQNPITERVTDTLDDPLREFQGKNIVWDETNLYLSTNYLPLDTKYNDVNYQRWSESFSTLSGSITKLNDSQYEFYDGEFSGSQILVTNGELNEDCSDFKKPNYQFTDLYGIRFYDSDDEELSIFMSQYNRPTNGYMSIFNQYPVEIPPQYLFILTSNVSSTLENRDVIFQLESFGVPNNTLIPFTITGSNITASAPGDFEVPYNSYFNVFNNSSTQTITVRNDQITEGTETLTLFLDDFPSTSVDVNIADQGIGYLQGTTFNNRFLKPTTADTSSNWVDSFSENLTITSSGLGLETYILVDEQGLAMRDPNASLTYNSFTNITNGSSIPELPGDFSLILSQDPATENNIITPVVGENFQKFWLDSTKKYRANFTVTANNSSKTFNQDFQFRNNTPHFSNSDFWKITSNVLNGMDLSKEWPHSTAYRSGNEGYFTGGTPYYDGVSLDFDEFDYDWFMRNTTAGTIVVKRTHMNDIMNDYDGLMLYINKNSLSNGSIIPNTYLDYDIVPEIIRIQETGGSIHSNDDDGKVNHAGATYYTGLLPSYEYDTTPQSTSTRNHWISDMGQTTSNFFGLYHKLGGTSGFGTYENSDLELNNFPGGGPYDSLGNKRGMKMYTYFIALRDNYGNVLSTGIDNEQGINSKWESSYNNGTSPGSFSKPWVGMINLIIYKN